MGGGGGGAPGVVGAGAAVVVVVGEELPPPQPVLIPNMALIRPAVITTERRFEVRGTTSS